MELQEHVLVTRVDNVSILKIGSPPQLSACLSLTSYFSVFSTVDGGQIEIRHDNLDSIERSVSGCYTHLLLRCKTLAMYAVTVPGERLGQDVYQSLRSLCDLLTSRRGLEQGLRFQFVYRMSGSVNCWDKYAMGEELPSDCDPADWRLTEANAGHRLCPGYPARLIVPARITDAQLAESAKHRIGGRFPVLAYLSPASRRFLLVGSGVVGDKRCHGDQALLAAALDVSCRLAGGQRLFGCLVDTRSAKTARAEGGQEPPQQYNQWRTRHLDLPQASDLLPSLCKLVASLTAEAMDAGLPRHFKRPDSAAAGALPSLKRRTGGSPHWMDALQRTLEAANQLTALLDGPGAREFACVLLHGRAGCDFTLLLAALAQVMLAPSARGFDGFLATIDRTFVQLSHPFHRRCSRSALCGGYGHQQQQQLQQQQQQQSSSSLQQQQQQLAESSPVFLLFLDCCRVLCSQHPTQFEFSSDLLTLLAEHAYCSSYGTFLFDDCATRHRLNASGQTESLWSHLDRQEVRVGLINPLYGLWPNEPQKAPVALLADTRPSELRPWTELYLGASCCPMAAAPPPGERLATRLAASVLRERELEERIEKLKLQKPLDSQNGSCMTESS